MSTSKKSVDDKRVANRKATARLLIEQTKAITSLRVTCEMQLREIAQMQDTIRWWKDTCRRMIADEQIKLNTVDMRAMPGDMEFGEMVDVASELGVRVIPNLVPKETE